MDELEQVESHEKEIEERESIPEEALSSQPGHARDFLVAIGASAGGLEGLIGLFSRMPPDLAIPYVVVQHLSPTHRSMLAQLIGRETAMKVQDIEDNTIPEPNIVYITPANRNLLFENGRLRLIEPGKEVMPKPSVNAFFVSLAENKGENVIGVILSGTGSDGANGIRAIKAAGGFTFAQDPASAKYTGMPQAAIDTGSTDWILPPDKIAEEIGLLIRSRGAIRLHRKHEATPVTIKSLLARVRQRTRIDFSEYKETTVIRRIERRMAAVRVHKLDEYMEETEHHPEELDRLAKDILISVTSFFRDRDPFTALREHIPQIFKNKQPGDEVRVWVPGCATGEEAYSIAMLFAEHLGSRFGDYKIQIFATDLDTDAMVVARKGMYPYSSLTDIDPGLVTKYFQLRGEQYEIIKPLREIVLFARQDLIQDPPFLRLDLISCRNLLIYFKGPLQARVLPVFHYALQPAGILFLGKSENILPQIDLFEPLSKEARIFRRRSVPASLPVQGMSLTSAMRDPRTPIPRERSAEEKLLATATALYLPPSVLVNAALDIQYSYGDISLFLEFPTGKPSHSLLRSIRKEFRSEVQTLVHRARQKKSSVHGLPRVLPEFEKGWAVRLAVHPLEDSGSEELFLTAFERVQQPEHALPLEGAMERDALTIKELQDELLMLREHLQTVVEELETSNEEMQALNEELQSSNEELQSTNEELETSNEELQSTNEELTTVNQELQVKAAELAATNADLINVMSSADFPILVVDEHMRLTRYNDAAGRRFRIGPADLGRHILDLTTEFTLPNLVGRIAASMRDRRNLEEQISDGTRHYQLRISPYFTQSHEIRGAVLGFWDNTELYALNHRLEQSEERLLAVMNNSNSLITVKDTAGRYEFANTQFERIFDLRTADILGKTDEQFVSKELADFLRAREMEVLRERRPVEREDTIHLGNKTLYFLSIRFPLPTVNGAIQSICTQSIDITARKHLDRVKQEFISTVSHELRTPLTSIRGSLGLLAGGLAGEFSPKARELIEVAKRNSERLTLLVNDILDIEKLESDGFRFEISPQPIMPLVTQAVEASEGLAKECGVRIVVTQPSSNAIVNVDGVRLMQVVSNLLSNAAKFSPPGSEIQVAICETARKVRVEVRDRGRGIPGDFRERVFEKFAQADSSDARHKGGSGLGLAISKAIIEKLGGTIAFHPNPGGGTIFYFELPDASVPPV